MAPFRDEHIIIIAPGSHTTLAQLGLPESFVPARFRIKSRMFPGEKAESWEPHKVRKLKTKFHIENRGTNGQCKPVEVEDDPAYEEDLVSDEGAVWPITAGKITDWPCFFALMHYIHNTLNPPFHTPILLISQPAWTHRDLEKLAQFFFEKFKTPAFTIMDAAQASIYAYGLQTAIVIDVGVNKADVTAVVDFLVQDAGRSIAIPGCGGEAMTQRLLELLEAKGFSREMCEQLKKSPICEILPPSTPLPGSSAPPEILKAGNPAAAASTGADDSGPNQRHTAASMGGAPRGPGQNTDVGIEDQKEEDDNEGVLDVASIVASGKMNEYLERKEREKAEKLAAKKKGSDVGQISQKPVKLRNAEREQNTFYYEDHALLDALKGSKLDGNGVAEAQAALDEGPPKSHGSTSANPNGPQTDSNSPTTTNAPPSGSTASHDGSNTPSPIRRELTVGTERFLSATGPLLPTLTSAIYRTVLSVPSPKARVALWDSLIIVGAGAAVRGFRDALVASLNARFLISPSSATMFTSEIPSATSTPGRTGTNTPQPDGMRMAGGHGQGVNPLLYAATTASAQQLQLPSFTPGHLHPNTAAAVQIAQQHHHQQAQSSQVYGHSQTPTSIKLAKLPEYFQEWKDVGSEESTAFLGAQVAAKVLFVVDQGQSSGMGAGKGYMTRSDYNEQGPGCIHDFIV